MLSPEYVVLVDANGNFLGTEEKIAAHQQGLLHLAFSVFLFNEKGEILLQQRAYTKYHFGGLWSNACCSHPRLNESIADAAHRRLREELGIETLLKEVFTFTYRAKDEKTQLIEHELDTVLLGFYERERDILFNIEEVHAIRWIKLVDLYLWINDKPDDFSFWFKTALLELKKRKLLNPKNIQSLFDGEK